MRAGHRVLLAAVALAAMQADQQPMAPEEGAHQ